ncbi:galactokinase [Kordiimonas sp. SCSIO 12610]|uniref:galactokinase n=1 Tax=Kordiimonas sp. SCSIO 12610 TaxID=2829597 RepID=UPI002109396B|nr:galactokinase [Kordiimonas sp. SCSIO 12610]UTW54783.1 galactokinase [Kordiimonas sp. SCSIO 12610]
MNINEKFLKHFGMAASTSASAPGRVNLIGEHIDYNGGTVLPTAINNQIHVAISPNASETVAIYSTRYENEIKRDIESEANGHWSDYIIGALQRSFKNDWIPLGLNIAIDSEIPDGAGVSSSAALITAIFRAVSSYSNLNLEPKTIAHMARAVENEYCGVPCGIMDQMAVNLSNYREALMLNTTNFETSVIAIPDEWEFVVIHSGVHRKLTDGRYAERFNECAEIKDILASQDLCSNSFSAAKLRPLPKNLAKRYNHIQSEHQRVLSAVTALKNNNMETFGILMNESHQSYSKDFEASTDQIDHLVRDAQSCGAVGARLTGGGFGGCIVCLLPKEKKTNWVQLLTNRNPETWVV